jgi:hypothetical protein
VAFYVSPSKLDPQLKTLLNPSQLRIENVSHQHRHHAAMRTIGGGTGETRAYIFFRHSSLACLDAAPSCLLASCRLRD